LGTISDSQNQTPFDLVFNSSALPAGPHTINVTVVDGHSLTIDYFLVENDLRITSVTPTPNSPTSSGGPTQTGAPGTPVVSKTSNIAPIVGGAIGGLLILALILILVLIRKRRARTRRSRFISSKTKPFVNNHPAFRSRRHYLRTTSMDGKQ
jgi:hypothetical protein